MNGAPLTVAVREFYTIKGEKAREGERVKTCSVRLLARRHRLLRNNQSTCRWTKPASKRAQKKEDQPSGPASGSKLCPVYGYSGFLRMGPWVLSLFRSLK